MNNIYQHPKHSEMQAEVILASKGPDQDPIYTVRMRYPRIIHGEIMTHRVFSRNARSSRAVPVATMLEEIRSKPFVPWHWGKNQKGMQASEECKEPVMGYSPEAVWLYARDNAVDLAEEYMKAGYHKQIVNRLIEPFSWIDTLITSNQWNNFLWLRDHKDAEPHLQDLARLVKKALFRANVRDLKLGEWHLPYINIHDKDHANSICGITGDDVDEYLCKISAARCARISYKPFDGDSSYKAERARYDMLVSSDRVHASPTEHQATPDVFVAKDQWKYPDLHGNLPGWIQSRKLIPGEYHNG